MQAVCILLWTDCFETYIVVTYPLDLGYHEKRQYGTFKFTFMHLADAFIQSDLQCIQAIHFLSVCVFPGKRTHNLCAANAML